MKLSVQRNSCVKTRTPEYELGRSFYCDPYVLISDVPSVQPACSLPGSPTCDRAHPLARALPPKVQRHCFFWSAWVDDPEAHRPQRW